MQRLKFTSEFIPSFLKEAIPKYEEMLVFIEENGGWINMPPKMIEMLDRLKLLWGGSYSAIAAAGQLMLQRPVWPTSGPT